MQTWITSTLTPAGRARAAAMDCYWKELAGTIDALKNPVAEGDPRRED